MIDLPIVHLKFQTYEIREDSGAARLCFDGRSSLAWDRATYGEPEVYV